MLAVHGISVAEGVQIGRAVVLEQDLPELPKYRLATDQVSHELLRFEKAVSAARNQLEHIRAHIPAGAPPEVAGFLDTHLMMLRDPTIVEEPLRLIRKRQNAEWALSEQGNKLLSVFEEMADPYLRNRGADVRQVVERVLRALLALAPHDEEHLAAGDIVVANDLTPADTVLLTHRRIGAFVTNMGSPISHTAILARSLGIPAIVSAHSATRYLRTGEMLIVDGREGMVIADPDRETIRDYQRVIRKIKKARRELTRLKGAPAITRDRRVIRLMANIELHGDVRAALAAGAEGIGLYRTEFLFMNRDGAPDEEEQFRTYAKVVRALRGRPVTIRTLDLGADKTVDGGRLASAPAINPALGLRAVRLCLSDITLFRPQLRAILRASALGNVRMMIPMLSSLDELRRVLELIGDTRKELRREGIRFDPKLPVGGMIEVPAAAVAADLFAPHLDFFSIGTNDLIQYTLAIDRVDDSVSYLYDPLHPAVLRLIDGTIQAGRAAGIPVAMCGEMAGDLRYTPMLLGFGLTEFSMHPANLLSVKQLVRDSDTSELGRKARAALRLSTITRGKWSPAPKTRKSPPRRSPS